MALAHVTDHEIQALRRLVNQYREASNLPAMVSAHTDEIQTLEDLFWSMYIETIDTATNAQLDVYGELVGQPREGRADDDYRLWIKTRIKINRGSGTPEQIIEIFQALVSGLTYSYLIEYPPAAFELWLGPTSPLSVQTAAAIMQDCRPAGIGSYLVQSGADEDEMLHTDNGELGLDLAVLADYYQ